jgi:fatty acid desaturase
VVFGGQFGYSANVGYHRVHHLHPQAALENLPKLDEWHPQHRPSYVQ